MTIDFVTHRHSIRGEEEEKGGEGLTGRSLHWEI